MANNPPRVVTFGEIMLRLSPPLKLRLLQAQSLDIAYGGAEANVAVSLAQFGLDAAFVTRLPTNDIGQACINCVRGLGVDTRSIARGGERVGIYFVEHGASQRGGSVTYDRAHSSISTVAPGEFNWAKILDGANWFHFTGITPALSDSAAEVTLEAAMTAKAKGLSVSCDLNFRKKLWSSEKAGRVMSGLMQHVDVCIANEEDADKVFGIKAAGTEVTSAKIDHERYVDVARQLTERFDLRAVAVTLRESYSASRNGWSGLLYTGGHPNFSRRYEIDIVDRLGAGDSFAAGLIWGLSQAKSAKETIEFAVAASCLKHSIFGDFNLVKLDEVQALAGGDGSGRVQR